MENNTGENVIGLANGLRIYSPDGAVWQTPTYDTAGGLDNYFDFSLSLNGFSVDGSGADTVGLTGVAVSAPGVPNGYDDVVLVINTQVEESQIGKTFCIDSTWFPPMGSWQWVTPSGTVIPEWEGPHCWEVVAPLATIEGAVFHDVDGNGVWDQPWDTGMPGVTVNLMGTATQSTSTGSNGEYSFIDLAAGTYRVYEDVPSGYVQTFPTSVGYKFVTTGYAEYTNVDFGNADTTCTGTIEFDTCFAGTDDDFVGAEPSSPDAALLAQMDMATNGANPYFDSACVDQSFGHTFEGCWPESCLVIGATLCMKLKATGTQAVTDKLYLGEWDAGGASWAITMNDLISYATGGADNSWNYGDVMEVCLDLADMPAAGVGGPQNLLGGLQDGRLDVLISDDTEVDYLELIVETCCEDILPGDPVVVVEPSDGGEGGTLYSDTPITFDIILRNYSDYIIKAITNGFRLYSPDGAEWETPVYYSTGALEPYLDYAVAVNGLGVDGIGEDTITLGGIAMYEPGIPIDFDEVVVKIETQFDAAQEGKTFCIDSTFFPPSGTWMWTYTGGSLIPGWGGPYCWTIAESPSCCVGDRGNVDGDPEDLIDISDLVYLVDYMFTGGAPPPCWEEANVDGSGDGPPDGSEDIDISDLVYLVDYMFNGGPAPVACP